MHLSPALFSIHRAKRTPRLAERIAWSAVLAGGLTIAALDLLYCLAFWTSQGASATRILQGVAAGLLGKASFSGGAATALLGAGLQWLIGSSFVLAYAFAARRVDSLRQHPVRHGIAYGLVLNLVMTRIVVPLSAYPTPEAPNLMWMLTNIPMFAVFGIVAAAFAQRTR